MYEYRWCGCGVHDFLSLSNCLNKKKKNSKFFRIKITKKNHSFWGVQLQPSAWPRVSKKKPNWFGLDGINRLMHVICTNSKKNLRKFPKTWIRLVSRKQTFFPVTKKQLISSLFKHGPKICTSFLGVFFIPLVSDWKISKIYFDRCHISRLCDIFQKYFFQIFSVVDIRA